MQDIFNCLQFVIIPANIMEPAIFDIACIFMAVFLPPLSVMMKRGIHKEFWIGVVLTFFGWFPGVIYALYIIGKFPHERQWPAPHPAAPVVGTEAPVAGTTTVATAPATPVHEQPIPASDTRAPATLPTPSNSARAIPSSMSPPVGGDAGGVVQ